MNDIEYILCPKSIAVVGASNRTGSLGLSVFRNLIDASYQGILYPVNPKARSIQGVKAYKTLTDIPDEVEMAVLIVPPEHVENVVKESAKKGVKGCIVITAGFKEVGGKGVELERRVKSIAREHGIRLLGPNCLGAANTNKDVRMNASFARGMPQPGNIAFVSQSGAMCVAILDYAAGRHMGFSKFVSIGNKADIDEVDLLRYLRDDEDTKVIIMYIEDITDGHSFIEVAREITLKAGKPIFALKVGRSPEGARAAASHTGSMAGSDSAYDAIFMQGGIQRVEGVRELFNYALAFSTQPLPKGNRVAIVTNSGGPGIMATDTLIRPGIELADFTEETREKLKESLPPTASIHNPVDVIGDADAKRYESAIRYSLEDENVDGAIVILTPTAAAEILVTAQIVPRVARDIKKPILCAFMGLVDVSEGIEYLSQNSIPNFSFPEEASRTMVAMIQYADNMRQGRRREVFRLLEDQEKAAAIIASRLSGRRDYFMTEQEAHELLRCYGFPLLKSRLVREVSEIGQAIEEVGLPLAMKLDSPDILHKSDAGGVRLRIKSAAEAEKVFQEIVESAKRYRPSAMIRGILFQEMAREGVEVILGSTKDPKFGQICMFGLGGIFVEALKDVSFRLAPMWDTSAENMIKSIKAYRVLQGIRGRPPADVKAAKLCILRLSAMVSNHPEIAELDINPLILYPEGEGCVVADARIVLSRR
ncbi:MAG: acyl-CoA synthetase [Deltaproteobacteria bacterium HGW-Deltaproteobacteria-15]|nr:MAG: acyl-CoA synthetase [Deltaproteobacteria bacterium HGW-Deltaproteobacteria-15]